MRVQEEHQDVLHSIEFAIIQVYRQVPELIDAEVQTAIEALIRIYGAEAQGKSIATRPLKGVTKQVMEGVQAMCEWRLGRAQPKDPAIGIVQDIDEVNSLPPKTADNILACLKVIQLSIKFWTQKGGRQGYLNYVKPYILR